MLIKIKSKWGLSILAPCLLLIGCQTTGNPREGGLFSWRETEARQREVALQQQADNAQQNADKHQILTATYQRQRNHIQNEILIFEQRVNQLLDENRQLESELSDLMRRKQLGNNQLKKLRKQLDNNTLLSGRSYSDFDDGPSRKSYADTIEQQNKKIHNSILLLLNQ